MNELLLDEKISHYKNELNSINEMTDSLDEVRYSAAREIVYIKQMLIISFIEELEELKINLSK